MAVRARRVLLLAGISFCSLNLWTGGPLAALWLGSRVQGDSGGVQMRSVFAVIAGLAVITGVLVWALGVLGARYDRLVGRSPGPRRQAPWMRAMSGERARELQDKIRPTAMEWVLVGTAILAAGAFEVWFFFFSGSPIGH